MIDRELVFERRVAAYRSRIDGKGRYRDMTCARGKRVTPRGVRLLARAVPLNDSEDTTPCSMIRWLWVSGSSVQPAPSAGRSVSWCALLA